MSTLDEISANTECPWAADDWLLVIDMQRAFCADGSAWKVEGFWDIAPRIERLLSLYGSRAIMTRYVPPAPLADGWRQYFDHYPSMLLPAGDVAWDIVVPHPSDARVETRTTFSKWDAVISATVGAAARLTICGVATECCVLATIMAAIDEGRVVRVVEDACAGASFKLHCKTMDILSTLSPLVRIARVSEVMEASGRRLR